MHNRRMLSRDSVGLQISLRMDQTQHANVCPPMSKLKHNCNTRIQIAGYDTVSLDKTFRSILRVQSSTFLRNFG